jgi:hypothetical protein
MRSLAVLCGANARVFLQFDRDVIAGHGKVRLIIREWDLLPCTPKQSPMHRCLCAAGARGSPFAGFRACVFGAVSVHVFVPQMEYNNGDVLLGRWENGLPNGHGMLTLQDGTAYKGNFVDGARVGMADLWWPNGDHMLVEFADDEPAQDVLVPEADLTLDTGAYSGTLYDGVCLLRHGKGTMRYLDGSVYTGDWHRGAITGEGAMRYANGSTFTGHWEDGLYSGEGLLVMMAGHRCVEVVQGQWKEGCMHGAAKRWHWNGAFFDGEYQRNKRHGTGTYLSPNGDAYTGQV